jgi:uncharacterized protein (DUF4415 family)
MEGRKNPYARRLKKQVTIRLEEDVLAYFKRMAEEQGIPYQNLINLYLRDCMAQGRSRRRGTKVLPMLAFLPSLS